MADMNNKKQNHLHLHPYGIPQFLLHMPVRSSYPVQDNLSAAERPALPHFDPHQQESGPVADRYL